MSIVAFAPSSLPARGAHRLAIDADHLTGAQATREAGGVQSESAGSQHHYAVALAHACREQALEHGAHGAIQRSDLLVGEGIRNFEDGVAWRQIVVIRERPEKIRVFAVARPKQ